MNIIFKNVGQGDSIIIFWTIDGRNKIGIIDCKINKNNNPIVEHLKTLDWNVTDLEFIILSHPHYDHFSGMIDLLSFCSENNIIIKNFGHTFDKEERYLNWSNLNDYRNTQLKNLIIKVLELNKQKKILSIETISKGWDLYLNENYSIKSLLPSNNESLIFTEKAKLFEVNRSSKSNSSLFNLFSTCLILYSKSDFVILTSDSTYDALTRIHVNEEFKKYFKNKRLILGQIPHHGSINNHHIRLWKSFNYETNTQAVVSAGENSKYNHPDKKVIEDFHDSYFKVYATNHVNGMKEFLSADSKKVSDKLNMTSNIPYTPEGDQNFTIQNGNIIIN